MTSIKSYIYIFAALMFFMSCSRDGQRAVDIEEPTIAYKVLSTFPHDKTAFTQGLVVADGKLYESTGGDNSWISEVDIATGLQQKKVQLDKKFFGEGICVVNNIMFHLTWQNHVGFIYDLNTLSKKGEFKYESEGWGLTNTDKNIIMSDGSDRLYVLDTVSLQCLDTVFVTSKGAKIDRLNELEYVDGYIYANRWQTDYILKIDPGTGNVVGKIDLSMLSAQIGKLYPSADVLNGVAYEPKSKTFLVTGKLWPHLFALRVSESALE
jgi:glutamine cyclotransferase